MSAANQDLKFDAVQPADLLGVGQFDAVDLADLLGMVKIDAFQPADLLGADICEKAKLYPRQVVMAAYEAAQKYPELLPVAKAVDQMIVHLDTIINEIGFAASSVDLISMGFDGERRSGLEAIEHTATKTPRWIFADDVLKTRGAA